MSALKLSAATACNYVRTATTATATAKTKPLLLSWTPNTRRTYHHHHHHHPACARVAPHSKVNNIPFRLGRKGVSSLSPNKSGFLGCGSASPSPSPSRHGLVTHDTSQNEPLPPVSTDSDSEPDSQPGPEPEPEPSKLLTLPTALTLGRVAAVPLLVATFYMDGWRGTAATTGIFIAAAVTDWLDGYIARKMKLKSSFGAFLDPVADKLMVAATLVLLCSRPLDVAVFGQVPWLLTVPSIAIIGREITMSAVREWAASQDSKLLEAVAVNNLGKWKTATQMTALTILLATRDWSHGGAAIVVGSGVVLLYTSAGLAVWSLVVYMRKIWRVLLR